MQAVILAGGKGTRLHPYTADLPKPLVPVGDQPIIERVLRHLHRCGVTRVVVAVNHLAHLIAAFIGDGSRYGMTIEYSLEDEPLSTVAPLKLMKNLPEHFLVLNGDVLSDLDVGELYRHHLDSKARITVACTRRTENIDFGVLDIGADNRVTGFREKPPYDFVVSVGIYVFSRSVLDIVPDSGAYGFDQLMLELIERGEPINSFMHDGYWLDIGRVSDYEQAVREIDRIRDLGL